MRISSLFFNSATSKSEVLLRWKRKLPHCGAIGSFAPIANGFRWFLQRLCLSGQKRLASIFLVPSMWSLNCWVPATTKRLLNFTLFFFTNCCLLCETSVYLNCFERKSWRATAKRRWHKLLNQWIH